MKFRLLPALTVLAVGCNQRQVLNDDRPDPCGDACPPMFTCLPSPDDDVSWVCIDDHLTQCRPCDDDEDCVHPQNEAIDSYCALLGDEVTSFCGNLCETDENCPEGAICQEVIAPDRTIKVCQPANGDCECSRWAIDAGASARCTINNVHGSCSGYRYCTEDELTPCDARTPAPDICNGEDDNCDGTADEDFLPGGGVTYTERDGTPGLGKGDYCGLGACLGGQVICAGPDALTCSTDFARSLEICDGIDNDCDGGIDSGLVSPLADVQEGICAGAVRVCGGPTGWLEPDYSALVGWEAPEATCDGLDNDCDGGVDTGLSTVPADVQEGVCAGATKPCDGVGGWTEPDYSQIDDYEMDEITCDDLDNDCDGIEDEAFLAGGTVTYTDPDGTQGLVKGDGCGVGWCAGGVVICNVADLGESLVCSTLGALDVEACDGEDNDCNGTTDDGLTAPPANEQLGVCAGSVQVCAGTDRWQEPSYDDIATYELPESSCDGLDNDCDGFTDTGLSPPPADVQDGVCAGAEKICQGTSGWQEPDYSSIPDYESAESLCDNLDNDCSGGVDDRYTDGTVTYTDLNGTADLVKGDPCGVGACLGGQVVCGADQLSLACTTAGLAGPEDCDGFDDDCNGVLDDGLIPPPADMQHGVCAGATRWCGGTLGWLEPNYTSISDYEAIESLCDELDNDCNGSEDEPYLAGGSVTYTDRDGTTGLVKGDGCGVGACAGGQVVCGSDELSLTCTTLASVSGETCDGVDEDCDGTADDGLTAPLNPNQNGACAGSRQICAGAGGWVPDYSAVAGYGQLETPDGTFFDENCDGIDGDPRLGVFVSSTGVDNPLCDMAAPCQDIAYAIGRAQAQGRTQVYVQAGVYVGSVTLANGIALYGGYDAFWVRDDNQAAGHTVSVVAGSASGQSRAFFVNGVTTGLYDLEIVGETVTGRRTDGRGHSSYGILVNSSSSNLAVERCRFEQGSGASGETGNAGANYPGTAPGGGPGQSGQQYTTGCSDSRRSGGSGLSNPSCTSGTNGGNGGAGGKMDNNCPFDLGDTPGLAGTNGDQFITNSYGYRGGGGATCNMTGGGDGNNGRFTHGNGGGGALFGGTVIGNAWFGHNGSTGFLGGHGGGGGGGGGAGGCDSGTDSKGGGGGGGGAGGCRSTVSGAGGAGGGGSFGIFATGGTLVVRSCTFVRGNGGDGGRGGQGGAGQLGGPGGSGGANTGNTGPGGDGGDGGRGGHSGGGGGGAGGIVYGMFTSASAVTATSGNTYSGGIRGDGGTGGSAPSGGNPGSPGANGAVGTIGTY